MPERSFQTLGTTSTMCISGTFRSPEKDSKVSLGRTVDKPRPKGKIESFRPCRHLGCYSELKGQRSLPIARNQFYAAHFAHHVKNLTQE